MDNKEDELDNLSLPAANYRERIKILIRRFQRFLYFLIGILAALGALLLYDLLFPQPAPMSTRDVSEAVAQALASATPPPAYSRLVYQTIRPSLVLIQTYTQENNKREDIGLGSGVVINEVGDILTSLHVVAGAEEIELTFADGTQTGAEVAGTQPEDDIAILKPSRLPELLVPATLGNPNAMRIGDEAFAVGNPFGLYSSMSAGVISGFDRYFQPEKSDIRLDGLIQIDAAVNPGNSGGPLLNRYGQVIGIVVGIMNPTDQGFFIGIGFAVPINVAAAGAGFPPY